MRSLTVNLLIVQNGWNIEKMNYLNFKPLNLFTNETPKESEAE